jgi:chromosome segregation ATPase
LDATIDTCRKQIIEDKAILDQLAIALSPMEHELATLQVKEAALVEELQQCRADILSVEGKIKNLPHATEEQRSKLKASLKHLANLVKSSKETPGTTEQDQEDLDEIDQIRLRVINAIVDGC